MFDAAKAREVKHLLVSLIDLEKDSLRFCYLGDDHAGKVEHFGCKTAINVEGSLIF